jgi:hypothetical protein
VPLKELLVDGDVLDGDEALTGFVFRDGVDEHRRIPIALAVERLWSDGHARFSHQMVAGCRVARRGGEKGDADATNR